MTECVLSIPKPPSVNGLYANVQGVGRVKTKKYREWIKEAGWSIRQQRPHKFSGEVEIEIFIRPAKRRKADGDNSVKALFDLLTAHRVIKDDNLSIIAKHSVERVDDIDAPECRVLIRDREGDLA